MKLPVLLAALLCGSAVQAQNTTATLPHLQERVQAFKTRGGDTTFRKGLQSVVVVPGNRVIALPQDNMPCIVPDTKDIAEVPNALGLWRQPVAAQIPNAWKDGPLFKQSNAR